MRAYYTEQGEATQLRAYRFYRKSGKPITFYATDVKSAALMAKQWGQRRGYKIYRKVTHA